MRSAVLVLVALASAPTLPSAAIGDSQSTPAAPVGTHGARTPEALADARARARAIALRVVATERLHRERVASLARLGWLYEQYGIGQRIVEVARLREVEERVHEAAMARHEREIGARLLARIRAHLAHGAGAVPPPPALDTPPEHEPEPEGKGR